MTKSLRPLRKIVPFVIAVAVVLSACGSTPANNAFSVDGTSYSRAQFDHIAQALHDRFGIPYTYKDVRDWAAEMRPAG